LYNKDPNKIPLGIPKPNMNFYETTTKLSIVIVLHTYTQTNMHTVLVLCRFTGGIEEPGFRLFGSWTTL